MLEENYLSSRNFLLYCLRLDKSLSDENGEIGQSERGGAGRDEEEGDFFVGIIVFPIFQVQVSICCQGCSSVSSNNQTESVVVYLQRMVSTLKVPTSKMHHMEPVSVQRDLPFALQF